MPDNSFDIVSKIDLSEVSNAIQQASKEIITRFDLKDSKSKIELNEKDNKLMLASAASVTSRYDSSTPDAAIASMSAASTACTSSANARASAPVRREKLGLNRAGRRLAHCAIGTGRCTQLTLGADIGRDPHAPF